MGTPKNYMSGSHVTTFVVAVLLLSLLLSQCWRKESTLHFPSSLFTAGVNLRRPSPLHKKDILPGVSVSRSITILPDAAKIVLVADGEHCADRDDFGDNVCHWDWNASIGGSINSVLEQPIQQDDYVEGHLKIDGFIPYKFRCALCGEDCTLSIPVVKANFTIPTTHHCPIPVGEHSKRLVGQLWANSPTDELVTTSLEATISAIQGSTGKKLVELKISAHVK